MGKKLQLDICAKDKHGNDVSISLEDLAKVVGRMGFRNQQNDTWMGKKGLYFDYPLCFDTNIGCFQKLYSDPAIIAFAKYKKPDGKVTGRVIFISKTERGTQFEDINKDLWVPYKFVRWRDEPWFWTQTAECRLKDNYVRMISNEVYDSLDDAVIDILESAEIREKEYRSFFPESGETLAVIGSVNGDILHAPFIFDADGTFYCKKLVMKGDGDED